MTKNFTHHIKYCTKCIMSETYPGIAFDNDGICSFCAGHKPHTLLGEKLLIEIINSASRRSKYDCVVPLSGGKDSTFVLYYATQKLNLKSVAVNYDSGMQSHLAIKNMENACKMLNIPLVVKKANYKLQIKRLRAMLKLSERAGNFVFGCGGCVPILQTATIGFAQENSIPLVFDGGSLLEHAPKMQEKQHISAKLLNYIRKYKFYNFDLVKYILLLQYLYYNKLLKKEMKVSTVICPPLGYVEPFETKGVKVIRFSNYIRWSDAEIVKLIKKELNWQNPQGTDKRFDCQLHCLSDFDHIKRYGISSNGLIYSNMVREGLMSREEAVLKEIYTKETISSYMSNLIDKIGLRNYKMPKFKT